MGGWGAHTCLDARKDVSQIAVVHVPGCEWKEVKCDVADSELGPVVVAVVVQRHAIVVALPSSWMLSVGCPCKAPYDGSVSYNAHKTGWVASRTRTR